MDKFRFMRLWDLYGELLTDTQREITDMYFNLDLTISEIAEQKGVSRQSVSDCLKVCKNELAAYEDKLGHGKLLEEKDKSALFLYLNVEKWADEFLEKHPKFSAEVEELMAIFEADDGSDVADGLKKTGK